MKTGDRVELTEALEDLPKGLAGTVVRVRDNASQSGIHSPYVWTGYYTSVAGVHFDGMVNPAVTRRSGEQTVMVVSKCRAIDNGNPSSHNS